MLVTIGVAAWLCLAPAHAKLEERQAYGLAGIGFNSTGTVLGNAYNYWRKYPNGTFDLTRSDIMPVTAPKLIPFTASRQTALIEPSRSVLCIIDMQNFFLHPDLSPSATAGRAAVPATVNMIKAFRSHHMAVTWVNWGLTDYDLLTIPPAFKSGFSTDDIADQSFGSNMGTITENGTTIQVGDLLMRGSWNAEPWGLLGPLKDEGLAAGTDFYFNKNRLSGLWGAQTPYGLWLQENEITTIFFGGVNADQCVWSTFIDAYFKGYDVIYVDDISATTSPAYATEMTRYNANLDGFVGNATAIIAALG
ncbi:isochorismatase hydrolase [Thozetella sp. PMI_491]|nr:isochorismatase hydrolase [Thozetella sp. PMI_491]